MWISIFTLSFSPHFLLSYLSILALFFPSPSLFKEVRTELESAFYSMLYCKTASFAFLIILLYLEDHTLQFISRMLILSVCLVLELNMSIIKRALVDYWKDGCNRSISQVLHISQLYSENGPLYDSIKFSLHI